MSRSDYTHYFSRRAEAELEAARRAASDTARRLHEELAALHRQRADAPQLTADAAA